MGRRGEEDISEIDKKRKRDSSDDDRSSSSESSSSESLSSSSSSSRRHSKKKSKRSSKSSSSKKSKDSKKKKKEKKKKEKKKKSKKHGKSSSSSKSLTAQWGSRGVITTADMYSKDAEFRCWLMEQKRISPEVLGTTAMKEYFGEFVEDWNTATLEDKYYNLEAYERNQRNQPSTSSSSSAFNNNNNLEYSAANDEEMIKRQRKQAISASANIPQVQMTREQLLEVKRVNEERIQADRLRKMGVKVKDSMGVRYDIY